MSGIELWILAIGLAMDCFAVSITCGLLLKISQWKTILCIAVFFGFFQAAMPFIGWGVAGYFSHWIAHIDHWIAFGILAFLGIHMIVESFKPCEEKKNFDPTQASVILTMAVATSIDALAVGVSFAFLGIKSITGILTPVYIIGLVSFVMSCIGLFTGILCHAQTKKIHAEVYGGIILILIGTKILIEHLFLT